MKTTITVLFSMIFEFLIEFSLKPKEAWEGQLNEMLEKGDKKKLKGRL